MKDPYNPPQIDPQPIPPYYGKQSQDSYYDNQDNLAKLRLEGMKRELEEFRHGLRHDKITMMYDENQKQTVEVYVSSPDNERILNDQGVEDVINFVSPLVKGIIIMGNWAEFDDINDSMSVLASRITQLFNDNFYKWGLTNEEKISHIPALCFQIHQLVASSYRRAYRGNEGKNLAPIWNINENIGGNYSSASQSSPIKKFNLLGGFGKWRK